MFRSSGRTWSMKLLHIFVALFLSFALAGLVACSKDDKHPSRSECIVRVTPPSSMVERTSEDARALTKAVHELGYPLGSIAYGRKGEIYFRFSERCAQRETMARNLMRLAYGSEAERHGYATHGPVPGPQTINVSGPSWKEE